MMLGKLPVLGHSTLDYSRTYYYYCACSRCGWGLFGHFFSPLSFLFLSLSLWETARYSRLKYYLKGPLSPKKQPTSQPNLILSRHYSYTIAVVCFIFFFQSLYE